MPTPRATATALLALLACATPAAAQAVSQSDYAFWESGTGDGWVDPEVAWRPDDPFWEGRREDRDDLILDWPGDRWPWPQPQPSTRGRLEAVVSGVTAQVYRERGRGAIQVDSRRVVRAAQEQLVRRDGGLRRSELGSEQVAFLVLIPLSEPLFFRDGGRHGGGRHGEYYGGNQGGDEYLVAAIQGRKDQIYYALPAQPYDSGSQWRHGSGSSYGTGNGSGSGDTYSNSIWYPGPDRHRSNSWNFDMAVIGVARRDQGRQGRGRGNGAGMEVVLGMPFGNARENRGYLDVGELARLGSRPGDGYHRSQGSRRGHPPVLGWTQDAQGNWLRRLRLQEAWNGQRTYTSDRVGGMAVSQGGLGRTVSFWRDREGDGESVSGAALVSDLRIREDGWALDEDYGTGHGHRRDQTRWNQPGQIYWGIVWQWDRGHRRDEPVYRPLHQDDPGYDDLLR